MLDKLKKAKKAINKKTGWISKPRTRLVGGKKAITAKKSRRKGKQASFLILAKLESNPIITAKSENGWEDAQTFNPGVVLLEDKVHFLYRAIGKDSISRLGYARSSDGFRIEERLSYPIYEHKPTKRVFNYFSFASGGSFGGCEDPRLVRIGREDTLYMTYTACDEGLRVALTSIKVEDFLQKKWKWKSPRLISLPGEVHKNWVIFPEKINGKYGLLTSINPKVLIDYVDNLEFERDRYIRSDYNDVCRKHSWDSFVRGAGPPPIKTKYGWLLFYHAIDKRSLGKYKVGAMLLDLFDPTKVLRRLKEPILAPEESYENNGFKAGVVYASGAVIKDSLLLIYYGGADSNVCVAYADFDKFLEALNKEVKPKLKIKILKKKK